MARVAEVIAPGAMTTVQDWPGRVGLWELGVPPSGPMDSRSMRIANRLLGNREGTPALEVTLAGPRLLFVDRARVVVCGAPAAVELDGEPVPLWEPFDVGPKSVVHVGAVGGAGMRCYLAVAGGVRAEPVLGSCATFAAARLGGGPLVRGDTLQLGPLPARDSSGPKMPAELIPTFSNHTTLRVVPGPHGAPDVLTPDGLDQLFASPWTVHHQSDRTGIRVVGPKPKWSRTDGGAAGLHPSNILDSAYGVGTVMLSGDLGVIVGVDGPSLGGFAAIGQVIRADRWRLGQLRAGDEVHFQAITADAAVRFHAQAEVEITELAPPTAGLTRVGPRSAPVPSALLDWPHDGTHGPVTYRRAGEGALLVEFGEPVLDLRSRVRVHTLQELLREEQLPGIGDLTPGVRSLHVQFEPEQISTEQLLDSLANLEAASPVPETLTITARTVHLPLAWRDSNAMLAVSRYQSSVRPDAPWCPDNIEFIRRINGLSGEAAVQQIVTEARYLVLGLGDVYMGAPIAVPLDPRHRLVTTKYTPARTWTPANAVGIGGAFLCVYGIEGPGGYQLVGRTVPIWYRDDPRPCLLNHFDQLRFELVSESELDALRHEATSGVWRPKTEPVEFSLAAHNRAAAPHAEESERFTKIREAAFQAERRAWDLAAERSSAHAVDGAAA